MPAHNTTPLVALHDVTYDLPDGTPLLSKTDVAFGNECTGLVGRNGVGKSTLLRLVLGDIAPKSGAVDRRGRIGALRQSLGAAAGQTVADLLGAAEGLQRLSRLAEGRGTLDDAAEADWTLEQRLDDALSLVGLGGLAFDRSAESLSGGEQTRVQLAGLVAAEPDLILLDEPTNNLDGESREAIAAMLDNWRAGAIVVSHDRALLNRMDRIVELSSLGARSYGGNYDFYATRKQEERDAAARRLDHAQRSADEVARHRQAVAERQARKDGQGARSRSRGDQPKVLLNARRDRSERTGGEMKRQTDRKSEAAASEIREAAAEVERTRLVAFDIGSTGLPPNRNVLSMEGVGFFHPGQPPLIRNCDFSISGPERIGVAGPNGSGKSTFLKLVTGELDPTSGVIRRPVDGAFLDQHVGFLDRDKSLVDNFREAHPEASTNHAHAVLARFLFRNRDAHKMVSSLSGGEALRAGLAIVLGGESPPPLLILDEPTNHLDIDSIQAVEAALQSYDGALLVVSHDTAFLDALNLTRRLEFPLEGAR